MKECFALAELQLLIKPSPDLVKIFNLRSSKDYAEKHIPGVVNAK